MHGIQSHAGWYEHSCRRLSEVGFAVSFLDRRGSGQNTEGRGDTPSFRRLLDVNPGFDPHNLATIATQMPISAATPAQRTAMYRLMRERLLAVPGVQSVGAGRRLPLAGRNLGSWMFIEGQPITGGPGMDVEYRVATPDYLETMRIPLRAGRAFDDRDEANPASVLLINETAARRFWPGENPVGKRVKLGATPERLPWITVVGVVGDLRHSGLDIDPRPEIYRPYAVNPLGAPVLVVTPLLQTTVPLTRVRTWYESMAAPPLVAGVCHSTVAEPSPGVTVGFRGADGTVRGTPRTCELCGPQPTEL